MKVHEIQSAFGLEHLKLTQRARPEPGPGEVLLRMQAMSLNYRDLLMVTGRYNPRQPLPLIPCSDGVGEVVALGPGCRRWQVGDRVATVFCQSWPGGEPDRDKLRSTLGGPLDGTLAEHMVLPEDGVVAVPGHLSAVEAATLPCAALTAWSALVTYGSVTAGDTVLLLGTGGVSIFALQFVKLLGARAILLSSSDEKLEAVRHLGAWQEINYRNDPKWGKTVLGMTDGRGVDQVVEVGGAGTLEQSAKAVKIGGQISLIGVLSGHASELNILPLVMKNVRLQGILVGSRDGFETMNRAIDAHRLKPVVDRVFPFEAARDALAYLAEGKHLGKICLQTG